MRMGRRILTTLRRTAIHAGPTVLGIIVLDFLLQGQQSPFVLGRERGYYAAQKVNLAAFDPGRGGADSITKVASGTHDIGFGDLSAMIEFNAKNPGRELIAVAEPAQPLELTKLQQASLATEATDKPVHPCPCCGGRMIIIETFEAGCAPRHRPTASAIAIRVDTS